MNASSPTDFITAFCDSCGRCPLVLNLAAYVENPDEVECPEIELFKDPNAQPEPEAQSSEITEESESSEIVQEPPPRKKSDFFEFLFE